MKSVVRVETHIEAPPERCFDLARDLEIHPKTTWWTHERVVGERTTGLIELNDTVTFEAKHFGIKQQLTGQIIQFERPFKFVDEMRKGAFKSLRHAHEFQTTGTGTLMIDILEFELPLGFLGRLFSKAFMESYMQTFLARRGQELKKIAES